MLDVEMDYWRICCGVTTLGQIKSEEIKMRIEVRPDTIK